MVRFPVLASAFVCLSLTAQPVRVTAPQPISVTRTGVSTSSVLSPMAASNGTSFLVGRLDNRFATQSMSYQSYAAGLLTRVDTAGNPLDEHPIAVPFAPAGIVWTGSEWIAGGSRDLARISAEGKVIEVQRIDQSDFSVGGLAWSGNRLVVVGTTRTPNYDGTGVRSITFDEELDVVAFQQLTDAPSEIVATTGDGRSAIVLWRGAKSSSPGTELHGASFGSDGLVQKISTNLVTDMLGWPSTYKLPVGATGRGYVVLYPSLSQTSTYKGVWLENDLDTRVLSIPSQHALYGGGSMVWDGTYLTLYSANAQRQLLATRFSEDGFLVSSPQTVATVPTTAWPQFAVAGFEGSAIVAYSDTPANELKWRVLAAPGVDHSPPNAGAFPQDFPASASTDTQSLVVWRERMSPTEWGVYATRLDGNARVLDPQSLPLAESSCDWLRPAVATNGEDYLAAWHDKNGIAIASIRADGTFTKRSSSMRLRYGQPCGEIMLRVVSNGTDYLLLWAEQPTKTSDDQTLFGLRLDADGNPLDVQPVAIGTLSWSVFAGRDYFAASNGQDYLIALAGAAVRLTGEGVLLDTSQKILLGKGHVTSVWWNGTTYVVETRDGSDYRFLRIASDGTGGRPPFGPQADPVSIPPGTGFFRRGWTVESPCDSSGCWVAGTTRYADGHDAPTVLRYEDDGTTITVRRHESNISYVSPCDLDQIAAGIVNAGRPAFLFLPQRMEQPFSSVHRLMIAPFAVGRVRAARH